MHPHLASALGHLEAATAGLQAAVERVPESRRDEQPSPGRWSVNEVIEHVAKVEQLFLGSLLSAVDAARTSGLGPEVSDPPLLPDQLRATVRDRTNPRNAPETVHPSGSVDGMSGLRAIEAGHQRLRAALGECSGLALSTVTVDHRFFGSLNVYQWVELLAGHEERHAAQVREVRTQLLECAQ